MTSQQPNHLLQDPHRVQTTISLQCLFQILTACCAFFALLKISPLLAIACTIVLTPAIIRTGIVADLYRQHQIPFGWKSRLHFFAGSIGIVLLTILVGVTVFSIISVACGLACVLLAIIVDQKEMIPDVALLGTVGGSVWGFAGLIVCLAVCANRIWMPKIP